MVHALKRLEIIDRDINELRSIEKELSDNRTYSNAIKISLELQINNLLNERVKLMELKIDNPPDALKAIKNEHDPLYHHKSTPFSFQEHENTYLPKLLSREDIFLDKGDMIQQEKSRAHTSYEQAPPPRISVRKQGVKSVSPSVLLEKRATSTENRNPPDYRRDAKDILKSLPTLED